jgi:NAD+ kinase
MKRIAIYANKDKAEAKFFARKAVDLIINSGADCIVRNELYTTLDPDVKSKVKLHDISEYEKHADMIISFGGDGTLLTIARLLLNANIPIMGFNVGKLGFLAEYSVEDLESSIKGLLAGNYRVVDRSVLETSIGGKVFFAINDFVIEKKDTSKMITVKVYSDEHFVGDYRADGIIITTPTGSTAYSLSCSGPIIAPSAKVICVTPISPHTLTLRPLVIPDNNCISCNITEAGGGAILVADGETVTTLDVNDTVKISLSEARVKLIKPHESSYYDVLRTKMLWAANTLNVTKII